MLISDAKIPTLDPIRHILFGEQGQTESIYLLDSGKPLYISAARHVNFGDIKKVVVQASGCKSYDVSTTLYSAIFISFVDVCALVFQPKDVALTLGANIFNQSIEGRLTEELLVGAEKYLISELDEINFDIFWGMFESFLSVTSNLYDLNIGQLNQIKLINSYKKMLDLYTLQLSSVIPKEQYYLESFSRFYFIELQCIARYFGKNAPVLVHDAATNCANLPNLINGLATADALPFKLGSISCSDLFTSVAIFNINFLKEKFSLRYDIDVQRVDLKKNCHSFVEANVIIANDVLEHFEEAQSELIFQNLWRNTRVMLVIHVPIETNLAKHFGHLVHFTADKLESWASKLPNCNNLTASYLNEFKELYSEDLEGFLILEKYS